MTGGNSIDVALHDLPENPALEGSSSCFSTGDLLSAPLDDSQGDLDYFELTPLPNGTSRPGTTTTGSVMFEPTPMRTLKPQLVKPVAPAAQQFPRMFAQQGIPPQMVMQQRQQPMLQGRPPSNMIQAQQLQAALANLRRVNQMGQPTQNMMPSSFQQARHPAQMLPTQQQQQQLHHASQMLPSQQMPLPEQPQMPNGQAFSPTAPTPQQRSFSRSPPPPQGNLKAYSTAMEKLCVTMKRSAMSRNMVKQMSGRNLSKQGSQRSLLNKQGSQCGLVKQNSGRDLGALARQASGRSLTHSPIPSGETPLRRSLHDSKHRIAREAMMGGLGGAGGNNHGAPPTKTTATNRGLFRHNSSGTLLGNRRTQLQIDDCNVGYLFDSPVVADTANSAFPPTTSMEL